MGAISHLLQVVRDEVLDLAGLARADDDAVLVGFFVDHVLAHAVAPIASELHEQLPFPRALFIFRFRGPRSPASFLCCFLLNRSIQVKSSSARQCSSRVTTAAFAHQGADGGYNLSAPGCEATSMGTLWANKRKCTPAVCTHTANRFTVPTGQSATKLDHELSSTVCMTDAHGGTAIFSCYADDSRTYQVLQPYFSASK